MSRSNDVFRHLTEEECQALLLEMRDEVRPLYKQLEKIAAATLKLRAVFLGKQPWPKRCQMIRKAMSLKINSEEGGEFLAMFFMERYAEHVGNLLDAFGVEHEEGVLNDADPAQPDAEKLKTSVEEFCQGEHALMRGILVKAFAAQSAIEWPDLDTLVFPELEAAGGTK